MYSPQFLHAIPFFRGSGVLFSGAARLYSFFWDFTLDSLNTSFRLPLIWV